MAKVRVALPFASNNPAGLVAKQGGNLLSIKTLADAENVIASGDPQAISALKQLYSRDSNGVLTPFLVDIGSYPDTILAQNPTAYWRLSDLSDVGGFKDEMGVYSGQGAAATTGSPSYNDTALIAEDTNGSFKFAAGSTSNYLQLTNPGVLDFSGSKSFSVTFWYKVILDSSLQAIGWTTSTTNFPGWAMRVGYSAGQVSFDRKDSTLISGAAMGNGTVADGTTYHMGLTYNGTTNVSNIYIDGVMRKQTVHTAVPLLPAQSAALSVMGTPGGARGSAGQIDEVALWMNTVLTDADVVAQYFSGKYGPN